MPAGSVVSRDALSGSSPMLPHQRIEDGGPAARKQIDRRPVDGVADGLDLVLVSALSSGTTQRVAEARADREPVVRGPGVVSARVRDGERAGDHRWAQLGVAHRLQERLVPLHDDVLGPRRTCSQRACTRRGCDTRREQRKTAHARGLQKAPAADPQPGGRAVGHAGHRHRVGPHHDGVGDLDDLVDRQVGRGRVPPDRLRARRLVDADRADRPSRSART